MLLLMLGVINVNVPVTPHDRSIIRFYGCRGGSKKRGVADYVRFGYNSFIVCFFSFFFFLFLFKDYFVFKYTEEERHLRKNFKISSNPFFSSPYTKLAFQTVVELLRIFWVWLPSLTLSLRLFISSIIDGRKREWRMVLGFRLAQIIATARNGTRPEREKKDRRRNKGK